jgi:hypothetical protein
MSETGYAHSEQNFIEGQFMKNKNGRWAAYVSSRMILHTHFPAAKSRHQV